MLERLILWLTPISALFGAAAFVVATVYLAFERCSSGCSGFLEGMNRSPSLSVSGMIIAGVVLVLACVSRWGRGFAAGFLVAFIAIGITTKGDALFLWGVPNSIEGWRRIPRPSTDRRIERLTELRAQPLDEQVGGELIYRVLDCIADRPPSLPTEIASGSCRDLVASWDGNTGPERLSNADSGWRWAYTRYPTGFQVAVYRDVMLDQPDPQFTADQTGRTIVRRRGAPPADYPRPR